MDFGSLEMWRAAAVAPLPGRQVDLAQAGARRLTDVPVVSIVKNNAIAMDVK